MIQNITLFPVLPLELSFLIDHHLCFSLWQENIHLCHDELLRQEEEEVFTDDLSKESYSNYGTDSDSDSEGDCSRCSYDPTGPFPHMWCKNAGYSDDSYSEDSDSDD
jgi:hypothetical protein